MAITLESLYNSIEAVKKSVSLLTVRVTELETRSSVYVTNATQQTALDTVSASVDDLNVAVQGVETKLQHITLPEDTRYYLQESEITDFRNHFRQLRSMMAELEKSRQAFIRLAARYNMTNSQV